MGQVYLNAASEARRRGDRRVGTDHLALAMLCDPAAEVFQALKIDLDEARSVLGMLDTAALATLGIDASFAGVSIEARGKERMPMTPAARSIFKSLRSVAAGERLGRKHVLLALLARQRPDPAAELFDALHVDRDAVRNRLRETT